MMRESNSATAKWLIAGYLTVSEPERAVDLAARVRMRYFEDVVEADPWSETGPRDVHLVLGRMLHRKPAP
jgi:hypothetical protein